MRYLAALTGVVLIGFPVCGVSSSIPLNCICMSPGTLKSKEVAMQIYVVIEPMTPALGMHTSPKKHKSTTEATAKTTGGDNSCD